MLDKVSNLTTTLKLRKFLKVSVLCMDTDTGDTTEQPSHFNPEHLSTDDLKKICLAVESIRTEVFVELARRAGVNKRPEGLYVPPKPAVVLNLSKQRKTQQPTKEYDLDGLDDLDL